MMNAQQLRPEQLDRFDAAEVIDGVKPERLDNATLISGRSKLMARPEIAKLPVFVGSDTHKPVPHIELIEGIDMVLGENGIHIAAEKFAINRHGNAMFGVMNLKSAPALPVTQDFSAAMAIRTANDKSMSIQLGVGARVFICDNMSLHADMIALKKKHTSGLDLIAELREAVKRFIDKFWKMSFQFEDMKNIPLTSEQAKLRIYDIFAKEILAHRYLPMVHAAYFRTGEIVPTVDSLVPYDVDFKDTLWSLHNAFTWALKSAPLPVQQQATIDLAREFALTA